MNAGLSKHMHSVPWSRPSVGKEEAKMVNDVLGSGWFSMGRLVREFENKFSMYIGAKHSVMVNNGTSALIAAYLAAGIKPRDKVLVPSYTFIATVSSLVLLGAQPILIDSNESTFNVDPQTIESALARKEDCKYVVVVDVAGMPCDLDAIEEVCNRHGAILIEDAAEGVGAEYDDRMVGSGNHPAIFSFHAAKLLTAIEGGMVVTSDDDFAEQVRLIRNHGEDPTRKYWHLRLGLNLRPLEIQAAFALPQLEKVDRFVKNRGRIARLYDESLSNVLTPQAVPRYVSVHPYMLYMGLSASKPKRDSLVKRLERSGVDYRIPWPPAHEQFVRTRLAPRCKGAERIFSKVISLPMYNDMSEEDAQVVIEAVESHAS